MSWRPAYAPVKLISITVPSSEKCAVASARRRKMGEGEDGKNNAGASFGSDADVGHSRRAGLATETDPHHRIIRARRGCRYHRTHPWRLDAEQAWQAGRDRKQTRRRRYSWQ